MRTRQERNKETWDSRENMVGNKEREKEEGNYNKEWERIIQNERKIQRRMKEVRGWFQECNKEEKVEFELELLKWFQQIQGKKEIIRSGDKKSDSEEKEEEDRETNSDN